MKGLIIKEPWIDLILDSRKSWEIRSTNTTIRGKIALIKSGSGKVVGEVEIVGSKLLNWEEYNENRDKHHIPSGHIMLYEKYYAWEMRNPKRYDEPIPYNHPQGAVIWVNLPEVIGA